MNFEQLFESNEQKKVRGHFENMIDLAKADGELNSDEIIYLGKVAKRFGISEEQFESMLSKTDQYAFNPPSHREERYDRFINLVRVISSDHVVNKFEIQALKRFAAGLDIPQDQVEPMVKTIREAIDNNKTNDEIIPLL